MLIDVKNTVLRVHTPCEPGINTKRVFELMTEGIIVPSHRKVWSFVSSNAWKTISDGLPCLTGTMSAYAEPGTSFKNSRMYSPESKGIVYTDSGDGQRYLFLMKEEHTELKDAVLLINCPYFKVDADGGTLVISPEDGHHYRAVLKFPEVDGWYNIESRHWMPCGPEIDDFFQPGISVRDAALENKFLNRWSSGRIGFVICGHEGSGAYRNDIDMRSAPSKPFGLLIEAPAPKVIGIRGGVRPNQNVVLETNVRAGAFEDAMANAGHALELLKRLGIEEITKHLEIIYGIIRNSRIR